MTFKILLHGIRDAQNRLEKIFFMLGYVFPENFPHFMSVFPSRYPNILLKYLVDVNILYDTTENLTSGEKNNTNSLSTADINYSEFAVTQKATGDRPNFESLHFSSEFIFVKKVNFLTLTKFMFIMSDFDVWFLDNQCRPAHCHLYLSFFESYNGNLCLIIGTGCML